MVPLRCVDEARIEEESTMEVDVVARCSVFDTKTSERIKLALMRHLIEVRTIIRVVMSPAVARGIKQGKVCHEN